MQTDGIDMSLRAAVDRDLYYRLEEVGKLLHLPIPLYLYRVNNVHSISIGSKEADQKAHKYAIKSELNAICRRMGRELFVRNKEDYLVYMRKILRVYYSSFLYQRKDFLRFAYCYVKAYRFNPHSFSHIYKITKGR